MEFHMYLGLGEDLLTLDKVGSLLLSSLLLICNMSKESRALGTNRPRCSEAKRNYICSFNTGDSTLRLS